MAEIDELKRIVNESSALSRAGQNQTALKLLDESITAAARENRNSWVRVLSRHAAVISDSMGDLRLLRHYCEQSLTHSPDDPGALYGMADVLIREGQADSARHYASNAYRLSAQRGAEADRSLIELILKRWPEIDKEVK